MILTRKQEEGLKIAIDRYRNHEPYTCIAGYAGTGKSTLIRFIIQALKLESWQVCYIAYTGKAVQVLRSKGCPNSKTAHKLLYNTKMNEDGTFTHIPKDRDPMYKVIVVDEVSMLPKHMWDLLLKWRTYVIALGDPGQLPPVAAQNNGVLNHPHVFLDEIIRQAQDSEIIRLATAIREEKYLAPYRGKEVRIVDNKELQAPGFLQWADQIIVGKNATRHQINGIMRKLLYGENILEPVKGDKVICLDNDWGCLNTTNDPLVNGLDGWIENIEYSSMPHPYLEKLPFITFKPNLEGATSFNDLLIDYSLITEHKSVYDIYGYEVINRMTLENWLTPKPFDYAYAITCHKSQGSEYDKVIVMEEKLQGMSKEEYKKWLYTAVTRAAKKLIVVRDKFV